ncbi:flagellar biosynthesis protein FliQ [Deferribacterales bacterium RsTz2092]|nr:flagellar biosynthetic protein FliQ [Deferribacterales bacterium]
MDADIVISLVSDALQTAVVIAMPMLMFGLVVGLIVSIFQAVTQIQEQTLSFIPKILAIIISVTLLFPWMLQLIVSYTSSLLINLNSLIGKV